MFEPDLRSGELVQLLPDWALPVCAMHILRRRATRPSARMRNVVGFAVARLG